MTPPPVGTLRWIQGDGTTRIMKPLDPMFKAAKTVAQERWNGVEWQSILECDDQDPNPQFPPFPHGVWGWELNR